MKGIEIEVPDQSDVLPPSVLKEQAKKNPPSVQSIIDSIPPSSSRYSPVSVSFRPPQADEMLRLRTQTPFSLFSLFFSSELLEIMAQNTNLKAGKEYSTNNFKHRRLWHSTSAAENRCFSWNTVIHGLHANASYD